MKTLSVRGSSCVLVNPVDIFITILATVIT